MNSDSNPSCQKRETFAKKLTSVLNQGALNLALAIGYKTGLLDAMDNMDGPFTPERLAENAGLDPRYVAEWLGIMVCGGIVEPAEEGGEVEQFVFPKEHGDLLARRAGSSNLGVYMQEIPLLTTCAMEPVLKGFYTGDGVSYDNYPRFQAFMGQLADAKHRQTLVDVFLPSVENGRMAEAMEKGIQVCDMGCAEGVALILMAEKWPASRFYGIDISREAIETARKNAHAKNLANIRFFCMDVTDSTAVKPMLGKMDYVTAFDAIHDQSRPMEALEAVFHLLKPGGRFSMVDIAAESRMTENREHAMGPFLYTVSLMHCMPVGKVENGAGLGMMWGKQKAVEMLKAAGFEDIRVREIPNDSFNLHYFCSKGIA